MNEHTKCDIYIQWNSIQWLKGILHMLSYATTWMKLEDIRISEVSQTQKNKYCDSTHMRYPEESNS